MKLYSALYESHDPFGVFEKVIGIVDPDQIEKNDGVLLLHGGEDISPSIYGERGNKFCHAQDKPSKRDKKEIALVNRAINIGMPIIGICRGAQLMCALSGGKLVQDIDGHVGGTHSITTSAGVKLKTNSIHHQMMLPEGTKHKLLAWCDPKQSKYYLGEDDTFLDVDVEPEIVYFEETKALAIQGHPEYLSPQHPFVRYCINTFKEETNVSV